MAEFVQQSIEEMLPELEQMERVGLFTESETRAILKKRKMHEYKLRRQTKHKEDFMAYVQYEINLLALIRKRRESTGYSFKKLEIDIAIVQRIHKLFKMAAFRFQEDVNIWLSYIEFCKKRNEKSSVSKVFTRMLQVHNKKPALWVTAAKWEFEDNLSSQNARSLLQRGLRFNPDSKELWLEYFRMELLYTDKLRKRKMVLSREGSIGDEEDEGADSILQCKIAPVVYRKAIEAIPNDVDFMLSFIPICQLFDFTQIIVDDIFADLKSLHGTKEITWDAIARQHLLEIRLKKANCTTKQEKNAVVTKQVGLCYTVFEESLKKINSDLMWTLYLKVCLERLQSKSSLSIQRDAIQHTGDVFQRACDCGKLSATMFLEWVNFLTNTAQVQKASTVVKQGTEVHKSNVHLWVARLQLMITCNRSEDDIHVVFIEARKAVKVRKSWPLWKLILDWSLTVNSDKLETLLEEGILECEQVCIPVKVFYLEWTALTKSIQDTRHLYKRLLQLLPLSVDFFQTYINLESSSSSPKMKRLRNAFEDAVREFGEVDADLWLDYITMELRHPKREAQNAGDLYCRAVKTLDGKLTDQFITKYTLLQTGHSSTVTSS